MPFELQAHAFALQLACRRSAHDHAEQLERRSNAFVAEIDAMFG